MQLASETLVLREQLMRNKVDSRTVGAALLATQEELKAAFSREQACEAGYSALLAELDSCRVSQETLGQHPLLTYPSPTGAVESCQGLSCPGVVEYAANISTPWCPMGDCKMVTEKADL